MTDPAPTDEQVAEWVALADAATGSDWIVKNDYVIALNADGAPAVAECYREADAAFIAAARTAVPALAAALSSARAERDEARRQVADAVAALDEIALMNPPLSVRRRVHALRHHLAALAAAQPTESAPLEPSPRRDEPRIGPPADLP